MTRTMTKKIKPLKDLDGTIPTQYEVDWDKVETIDDIKLILKSSYIIINDNYEGFKKVKHLLK